LIMERHDAELLIKYCKQMAVHLLVEQEGEFYPVAGSIDMDGNFNYQALYDGDEFPTSKTLIDDFKTVFEERLAQRGIRAYAIAYDVRIAGQEYPRTLDAIRIYINAANNYPAELTFPYLLENGEVRFYNSNGEL
jgi:hypothetical protein